MQQIIERLFGTTIRPEERKLVALLTLDLFVMLTVYYMLKVVREPLILLEGGVVSRNAARGTQTLVLLALVPIYSVLANRIHPRRLVTAVLGFFLLSLLAFPLLVLAHVPMGFAFFVWLGIFSITAVAQFWSLANDVFSEAAGKRLFPIIAAGAAIGGMAGAQLVALSNRWLSPTDLILVAAGLLGLCIWLTHTALGAAEALHMVHGNEPAPGPRSPHGGFRLLFADRYLLLIGLSILVLNLVNTTGDQVLALLVQDRAAHVGDLAAQSRFMLTFYGNFQTSISVLTALLQIFAVGRVLRSVGLGGAVLVLPLLALGGYGLLAVTPALMLTRGFKIFENSTGYSLQNTVQQVLFLPTSRDVKYKGKTATDTFFVRFGDLGSWALVSVALHVGWGPKVLSLVNVAAATVWLVLAVFLARRYQTLVGTADPADRGAGAVEAVPVTLDLSAAKD